MISVIVPVYKAERVLCKCLTSICAQTVKPLKITLVDDGSPDGSAVICEEWSLRDLRISTIHKNNGGAADSRNTGTVISNGDFIGFVDSDDWIDSRMYEILMRVQQTQGADIVECLLERFDDNTVVSTYDDSPFQAERYNTEQALEEIIRERKFHQTPVNKLYKRSLAVAVAWQAGKICEDEYWTYQVIGMAAVIASIPVVLYHYYQSVGSVMRQAYSLKRLVCVDAYEERLGYVTRNYPRLIPVANRSYLGACMFHYQMLTRHHDVDASGVERAKLHRRFCTGDWRGLVAGANLKYKVWYMLFRVAPDFTARVRNAFGIGF